MTSANDIEAQAMQWLVRLEAPDGPGLRGEFEAWCASDARRHATYIRLRSAWRRADQLRRLAAPDGSVDPDLLAPPAARRRRAFNTWSGALAAGLVLAAGAAAWWQWQGRATQIYATPVGGFQRVALSDGSTLELDTDSKVRVRFDTAHRAIELLRGQANFRVAQDVSRPFAVRAGDATVRALGTAFVVRLREGSRIDVLVTEGRVAVEGRGADPATAVAGDAVVVEPEAGRIQAAKAAPAEVARQLSWVQGRLTLEGETLREAVAEFNRYNPRKLVIADPSIEHIRVGGSFQPTDPQSFVTALERSFGVRARDAGQHTELHRAE